MYNDIVDFAELERFMDQKLKNYSSGMQVRLAFSIAIRAHSDILLIDEVLAVGDAAFQAKCFDHFAKLKQEGNTVILVSHDRNSLQRFCDRGIFINDGQIQDVGPIAQILASYNEIVLEELDTASETKPDKASNRQRAKKAQITTTETLSTAGKPLRRFTLGQPIVIRFKAEIRQAITNPIFGVTVWQRDVNKPIYATNTTIEKQDPTGQFKKGNSVVFRVTLPTNLNEGEYYIEPAVANEAGTAFFDQQREAAHFFISGGNNPFSTLAENNSIVIERHT